MCKKETEEQKPLNLALPLECNGFPVTLISTTARGWYSLLGYVADEEIPLQWDRFGNPRDSIVSRLVNAEETIERTFWVWIYKYADGSVAEYFKDQPHSPFHDGPFFGQKKVTVKVKRGDME